MTTDTKKSVEPPIPAVLVYGPPGSGKTMMLDIMMKFFGTSSVEDGYTLPPSVGDGLGKNCRWNNLKPGVLYITNEQFTPADMLHAGFGHGVYVTSIWEVLEDLGQAKGRTAASLYTERAMNVVINDILSMGGPRRGGGAPRQPR